MRSHRSRADAELVAYGRSTGASLECALPMDAVANGATIVGTVADVGNLVLGRGNRVMLGLDVLAIGTGGLGVVVKAAVDACRIGVGWADVYKLASANVGLLSLAELGSDLT